MPSPIADALVRIRPTVDNSEFATAAGRAGKEAGEAAGKNFSLGYGSIIKGAIGALTAGAAVKAVSFFKDTVTAASDLSESTSKLKVVFGQSSAAVIKFGADSAQSMGISQRTYRDTVGTLGNLLVSLKLPQPEVANMSTKMVKLAGDMASFNNTSPEDALEALRAGLTGETEPLRKYGVNLNDATLRQEAVSLGLEKTTKNVLPPAVRAQAAYALILDQTKTAQGDFSRTSSGLANSQRILAAQFDDLKTRIGTALLPVINQIVSVIRTNVMPAIGDFVNGVTGKGGISGTFGEIGASIRNFGADLKPVAGFLLENKNAIIAFVAVLGTAKVVIEAVTVATRAWAAIQTAIAFVQLAGQVRSLSEAWVLLDAAMDANPIGIVVLAIAALVAGAVLAYNKVGWFRDGVNAAWDGIKAASLFLWHNVFEPMWQGIKAGIDFIMPAFKAWYDGLKIEFDLAKTVVLFLWHNVFEPFWHGIEVVFNGIVAAAKAWWTGIKVAFDGVKAVIEFLTPIVMAVWHGLFEPVFSAIGTIVKNFYIIFKDIITLIVDVIRVVLIVELKALQALWGVVWNAIKAVTSAVWDGIKIIWQAIASHLSGPLSSALSAFRSFFTTIWNAVSDVAKSVWDKIKPLWDTMSNFVTKTLPDAFRTGVDAISRFWNALQDKVKTPINFVIGFINRGIIGPINSLVGTFGGTKLSELSQLHNGGLIPGSVKNDGIIGLSGGGVPTARVESGEFVVNREATRKNFGLISAINSGLHGYAGGGLVGDVVDGIGAALDAFSNPVSWLLKKAGDLGGLVGSLGNNGFAQMLVGIPRKLIDWAATWLKDKLSAVASAGGGPAFLGGPGGNSVAAILAIARRFDPTAQVSSGYRPGAADYHGAGLAADIIGSNMDAIAQGFYGLSGRLLELIHSPSWFVKNGQRVGADFYRSVFAEHFNHVHVAAYANALGFANGGTITEKIWGIGASGRRYTFGERGPETVVPGTGGGSAGVNMTINIHGDVSDAHVQQIKMHVDDAFKEFNKQLVTGRRK